MDAEWTMGGRWVDAGWTVPIILERDGHGKRTGWSRKVDGMVTEAGRDGHGKWTVSGQKRKIYCSSQRRFKNSDR